MNRLLIRDCIFNTDQVALIAWTREENVLTVSYGGERMIELFIYALFGGLFYWSK